MGTGCEIVFVGSKIKAEKTNIQRQNIRKFERSAKVKMKGSEFFEDMLKVREMIVNKAKWKPELQRKERTGIDENNTKDLRDVKKKNRPLLVSINYKAMKRFMSNKNKQET